MNIHSTPQHCEILIVGGEEDELASPELLRAWVEEVQLQREDEYRRSGYDVWRKGGGRRGNGASGRMGVREIVLKDVGHWACVEEPLEMSKILVFWGCL